MFFMAKKMEKKEGSEQTWAHGCSWREVLYCAGAIFFGALGFALVVEGLFGQFNLGFRAGFVSYLLGFLFLGVAKHCKWAAWCRIYKCN